MPDRRIPINPLQGERLRKLMRDNDMSQTDLAKIAGVSQQAISKYILCQHALSYRVAKNLADRFGVMVDWLMCFETEKADPVKASWVNLIPPKYREPGKSLYWMCSKCKHTAFFVAEEIPYRFCPNCGVAMEGESDHA